jgi:hypothetical protein
VNLYRGRGAPNSEGASLNGWPVRRVGILVWGCFFFDLPENALDLNSCQIFEFLFAFGILRFAVSREELSYVLLSEARAKKRPSTLVTRHIPSDSSVFVLRPATKLHKPATGRLASRALRCRHWDWQRDTFQIRRPPHLWYILQFHKAVRRESMQPDHRSLAAITDALNPQPARD